MDIDQIFNWILTHPKNYPGKHQESQPRTIPSFKPLEPKSQVIFNCLTHLNDLVPYNLQVII